MGDALVLGDAHLTHPAVTMAVTKSGKGYWVFDTNGCVERFGDAQPFAQSVCSEPLQGPVLDAATTPSGLGYWLVASDGGIFAFGDAPFKGSMGGARLQQTRGRNGALADGTGYWEVAADGGIFSFNVPFYGSAGDLRLNRPVVGMIPSGLGYMMVASDGGVFNYGNAFYGSLGASPPPQAMVGVASSRDTQGRTERILATRQSRHDLRIR